MSTQEKNPERVAAGLKSTVHNPRTSEEAKAKASRRLDEMDVEIEQPGSTHNVDTEDVDEYEDTSRSQPEGKRVMGGYRATLKNPRVSEEAKEHAKEVLEKNDEPLSTR